MQALWERAADFLGLSDSKPASRAGSCSGHAPPTSPRKSESGRFARKQTEDEARAAARAAAEAQADAADRTAANSSVLDEFARRQAVLTEAPELDGGKQGLTAIEDTMTCDADGDRAHGFIIADRQPERPTDG
ncbi:hypothetical protein AB1Y20_001965 [Prymnesium parvum]|uniref:Uncharacterized protein n=1 Tax=Prymnesium parvum TaxID=97485 RepID=A0AB34J9V1_PRYPA